MKNKAAQSLGKLGKGIPKTMTPAAKASRLAQMERINTAKRSKTEQMIRQAFIAGFNASAEGYNGEYGCDTSDDYFQNKVEYYVQSVTKKTSKTSPKH